MLERTTAPARPQPTRGSLTIALRPSPARPRCPAWPCPAGTAAARPGTRPARPALSPREDTGSPRPLRSPQSCPVTLAAPLGCVLCPLLPCWVPPRCHPQSSTVPVSLLPPGTGPFPRRGGSCGGKGAGPAVSHEGLGAVGCCWWALGARPLRCAQPGAGPACPHCPPPAWWLPPTQEVPSSAFALTPRAGGVRGGSRGVGPARPQPCAPPLAVSPPPGGGGTELPRSRTGHSFTPCPALPC